MTGSPTNSPNIKGWCPGAYQPMMSGDGLVVRVRPVLGRLTANQACSLCDLAERYGSGLIDLTSRANLQIRGVSEDTHEALLADLQVIGLLPDDPALESRRNILVPFDWLETSDTHAIATNLMAHLQDVPALPAKMGFAIDAGPAPMLQGNSADFRIERGADGLILRADGADFGRPVTRETALPAMLELAEWFIQTDGPAHRRMKAHVRHAGLPQVWKTHAPRPARPATHPGPHALGALYGAAFGQIRAAQLRDLIETSGCTALRTTPWRLFLLEDAVPAPSAHFITAADDPLLNIDACPGAPFCTSATVQTRQFARALAGKTTKSLHISGCAKGCARPSRADLTLVGNDGSFDLVKNGKPWDAPDATRLMPDDLIEGIGDL